MKARLIIVFLIDGLVFPILEQIGVVTVVICFLLEKPTVGNAVVCTIRIYHKHD